MKNLTSKIIYSIVFAVVIYLLLAVWGSRHGLSEAILKFNWGYLPLLLILSLGNYLLRFVKWQYYLKILKIVIPRKASFIIHMSGLGLSITPGKLGEVVKSYFLKKCFGHSVSKTAPVVLADRLTDMMALVIMTAAGAIGFSYGQKVIWIITILVVALFLAIVIKPIGEFVLALLSKVSILNKYTSKMYDLYDSSYSLLAPKRVTIPLIISLISWSFEAIAFYFVFVSFGLEGFLAPFFIYSFSTIVGAVSMLPGGLGATEGTISGLMKLLDINLGVAALATIIIRATTLWFAVLVGLVFLIIAERSYVRES